MPDLYFALVRATILAFAFAALLVQVRHPPHGDGPGWQLRLMGLFLMTLGFAAEAGFSQEAGFAATWQGTLTAGTACLAAGLWMRGSYLADQATREDELARERDHFHLLAESRAGLLVHVDATGRIVYANPALRALFGVQESLLEGRLFTDLVTDQDRPGATRLMESAVPGQEPREAELTLSGLFGPRRVLWSFAPTPAPAGLCRGVVGVGRDVTRAHAGHERDMAEARLCRNVFENAPAGLLVCQRTQGDALVLARINPGARRILGDPEGLDPGAVLHKGLLGPEWGEVLGRILKTATSGQTYANPRLELAGQGRRTILSLRTFPLNPGEAACILEDVTARESLDIEIESLVLFDAVTGLPNRTLLLDRADRALQRRARRPAYPLALLLVDLDRFEDIRDALGHEAGDQVLRETADRLSGCVRTLDTVARCGQDEFCILLEDFAEARAPIKVLRRVRQRLAEPLRIQGTELSFTANVGIALGLDAPGSGQELLRRAEAALRRAKAAGPGRVKTFTRDLERQAKRRMLLERDLDQAMQEGCILPLFSPVMTLEDGRLAGFLVQPGWEHPDLGTVATDELRTLARLRGQGPEMERRVLVQACRAFADWRTDSGRTEAMRLLFRPAPTRLAGSDFADRVLAVLAETGLPPHCLELAAPWAELSQPGVASRSLGLLRERGVRLALHDFGTAAPDKTGPDIAPVDDILPAPSLLTRLTQRMDRGEAARAILTLARSLGLAAQEGARCRTLVPAGAPARGLPEAQAGATGDATPTP